VTFAILFGRTVSSEVCEGGHVLERRSFLPAVTCDANHIKGALQAKVHCKPRMQVVQLPWPNNTDLQQMTPTHVEVARCGGGCHHLQQSCVARLSRMKIIPVMVAKCGISVGLCDKECASVEVEEHLECGCECAVKREDCSLDQEFRKDLCTCQCRDREAVKNCQESGRVWDRPSCSCKCPMSMWKECSTGFVFGNDTCMCIPESPNAVQKKLKEDVSGDFFFTPDILIIGILLAILLVFLVLTLILTCKLHKLKVKLRTSEQVLLPSTLTKNLYVPYSDPCKDVSLSPKTVKVPNIISSDEEMSGSDRQTDSSLCCDSVSDTSTDHNRVDSNSRQSHHTQNAENPYVSSTMRSNRSFQYRVKGSSVLGINDGASMTTPRGRTGGRGFGKNLTSNVGDNCTNSQVQIVYKAGDRTMELSCQLPPENEEMYRLIEKDQQPNYC